MLKILVTTALFATVHSIGMEQVPQYVEVLEKLPFQVSIGFYNEGNKSYLHKCGGSIISDRWVLTAAQCSNINIVLAGSHIEYEHGTWSEHRINETVPHPFFNNGEWSELDNDIMLIGINEPFKFNNTIKKVPLSAQNEKIPPHSTGTVGRRGSIDTLTSQCEYARMINPMNVSVLEPYECYGSSENLVISNQGQICTKYYGDYDRFCFGDVGGPLIIYSAIRQENTLAGILSHPIYTNPEESDISTMSYTRVAHYRDWIAAVSGV